MKKRVMLVGTISKFVRDMILRELTADERKKFIQAENERKMAEVREQVRQREQAIEMEKILNEIFAELPEELPAQIIDCPLADDILGN